MGIPRYTFKKKMLAASIAAVTVMTSQAMAQDNPPVEEVLVTGIRAATENALQIKRDSSGVVDAISAEDIGKMPDQNLAESLQRITGISISRNNGEGAEVTARGIDARFNMVTVNGRYMPTVKNDGTVADNATRAFDFANLASESVSGLSVYKTGRADLVTGGLGATVDIKTIKPLDAGNKSAVAAKAVHDTTVINNAEVTPEVSGLYSWVNEEDTFGISLVGAHQVRDSGRRYAFVNRWDQNVWGAVGGPVPYSAYAKLNSAGQILTPAGTVWAPVIKDGKYVRSVGGQDVEYTPEQGKDFAVREGLNLPAMGQFFSLPTDVRYQIEDNNRERNNGIATLQFKPTEQITATLDYSFSENKLAATRSQQSTWFSPSNLTEINFDNNTIATPSYIVELHPQSFKDVSFAQQEFTGVTQNDSLGLNLEFAPSDNLTFTLDFHDSKATNQANRIEAGMAAQIALVQGAQFNDGLPVMSVAVADCAKKADKVGLDGAQYTSGNCNGILDGGDISTTIGQFNVANQLSEVKQLRLGTEINLDALSFFNEASTSFGVDIRNDKNNTREDESRITMGNWGGVDPKRFDDTLFTAVNFGDYFPDYSSTTSNPLFLSNGVTANVAELLETVEYFHALQNDKSNFNGFPNGKAQWDKTYRLNRTIEEDHKAAFVQFDGRFDLGNMEAGILAGLRYETTDLTATSLITSLPSKLIWESNDDWRVDGAGIRSNTVKEYSYNSVLPSLSIDLSPVEDITLRAAYGKTIGRAEYFRLASAVRIENPILNRNATRGNPELAPMESDNLDFSVEWYYSDDSYASATLFNKKVKKFVGNSIVTENHYGLRDPLLADDYLKILRDNPAIKANTEAAFLALALERGIVSPTEAKDDIISSDTDPLAEFKTTVPTNQRDTTIQGLELGAQHWFGDSGFGLQANYTLVDADDEFDVTKSVSEEQFAMIGLSDTANLVGFYENYGWQLRLAYNWRDEYIENTTVSGANNPIFVEAFSQLDFSIGYEIDDQLSVSLEGLNITEENSRKFGRNENQMLQLEDLGARYAAGIRYEF
jgi:TonB-dependent receptor